MTSKTEWIALAERCQKATGPEREIDGDIAHVAKQFVDYLPRVPERPWLWAEFVEPDDWECWEAPEYTASLDAITALIAKEMTDAGWSAHSEYYDENVGRIMRRGKDTIVRYAATPALALCAAFCRAMAEREAA
jgi:hypothetical protein